MFFSPGCPEEIAHDLYQNRLDGPSARSGRPLISVVLARCAYGPMGYALEGYARDPFEVPCLAWRPHHSERKERCPPRQKSRVERLKAKVELLFLKEGWRTVPANKIYYKHAFLRILLYLVIYDSG